MKFKITSVGIPRKDISVQWLESKYIESMSDIHIISDLSKIDIGMEITQHHHATVVNLMDWFPPINAQGKRNKGQENMLPSQL